MSAQPLLNRASRRAAGFRFPVGGPSTRSRRISGACPDCPHRWKHHKQTGRCRPGCHCTNGAKRARTR